MNRNTALHFAILIAVENLLKKAISHNDTGILDTNIFKHPVKSKGKITQNGVKILLEIFNEIP